MGRLPLAWKAATLIEPGRASLTKAPRTFCLEIAEGAGLLMAGKLEVSFVEKVRFEAAARQVCRSIVGRTIEAISNCYNPSFRNGMIVMFLRLNVVHDSFAEGDWLRTSPIT